MFNIRLKQLRTQSKETQSSLAEKLGVSSRTIAAYEQGINEPSIDTLIKLSEYFNVTVDYLIGKTNVQNIKYDSINKVLGLSDVAISEIKKCNELCYNIFAFIENKNFIKLMEAYTEYTLLINMQEPIEEFEYGYDSFDMSDPFDIVQKNLLDHLQSLPTKEAYNVYLCSIFQKLLNESV